MADFQFRQSVLLLIGLIWALKALVGLVAPQFVRRLCRWWSGASLRVGLVLGWVCVGCAVALYAAASLDLTFVEKLVGLVALGLAAMASIYFKPQSLLRLMDTLVVTRSDWFVRLISLISLLIGLLLILVAVVDYNP